MAELQYEVVFIRDTVNVVAISFVDEGDFSEDETLEQVAIRRAMDIVNEVLCSDFNVEDFDEITAEHIATIGGN